jgi:hypothetical protein
MDSQEANCRLRFYLVSETGRSEDGGILAEEIINYAGGHGITHVSDGRAWPSTLFRLRGIGLLPSVSDEIEERFTGGA